MFTLIVGIDETVSISVVSLRIRHKVDIPLISIPERLVEMEKDLVHVAVSDTVYGI